MTGIPVKVSAVKHKTFVELNDKGTEATAVNFMRICATSALPVQKPFIMIVNYPFYCAIVARQTETILFMGAIVDPQE